MYPSPNETTINSLALQRKELIRRAAAAPDDEQDAILSEAAVIAAQLTQYMEYSDADGDAMMGTAYGLLAVDVPEGEEPELPDEPRQDAALNQIPPEKRAELVIRSVYEGDETRPGGTQVIAGSVHNLQVDTPPGGWSCTVEIDGSDGRQTLQVVFDGEGYSDTVAGAAVEKVDALPKPQPL